MRCAPNADGLALAEALARSFAHADDDGAFGKARNDDETVARTFRVTASGGLGLKPRRVMRYVFDEEHLVRIGVAKVRNGGPGDRGLSRTVESIGEAPPQYDRCGK